MPTIEGLKLKFRAKYISVFKDIRNKKLINKDFTIISNNCWGSTLYQSFNLKYNTPTVGLYFMSDDYIKFLKNIKKYISKDVTFIDPKESKWFEMVKNNKNYGNYPVGQIDDIEIFFMHYKDEKEAKEKWEKRKQRINYSNILYKFSEMNNCSEENIIDFCNLKYKNKICFVTKKYKKIKNDAIICINKNSHLKASNEPITYVKKNKIVDILNNLI